MKYFALYGMQINLDEVEYITETTLTIRGTRRRTTVPKEIVEHFGLKDGDRIRWILFKDNTLIIVPKIDRKASKK
ncbi:MAG TPA: AbrB/MazE/SpoVT family DNA-binding domain-containing protein [Candidatus Bathyarchaeota archaeon]|nr:AbrB/MazE/SpoVT family DNA-binding domain-containing protein [Candidatus Bathyarchaeota archaeon]